MQDDMERVDSNGNTISFKNQSFAGQILSGISYALSPQNDSSKSKNSQYNKTLLSVEIMNDLAEEN